MNNFAVLLRDNCHIWSQQEDGACRGQDKRPTAVEGNSKAPFSSDSTVTYGRGERYSNSVACKSCPQ